MLAAQPLDEARQPRAGHRVRHDGSARALLQIDGRQQRDEAVAVDGRAVFVHDGGAVAVRVKDHARVGVAVQHRAANGLHRARVLGVGDVVGEQAVGVEVLAALNVRAQRRQHALGEEPARAVARVHHDALARQRPLAARLPADEVRKALCIGHQIVHTLHLGLRGRNVVHLQRDVLDLRRLQPALCGDELHAVALEGQVRGRDHDGAVAL